MAQRILIVSADAADVSFLRNLGQPHLTEDTVDWAWTLGQALSKLAGGAHGLVLADCSLPDSHGLETVARLHAAAPSIPLLTLHGDEHDPLAKAALECGASGFVVKQDYQHYLFKQTVHNLLRSSQLESEAQAQRRRAEITLESIGDAVITTSADGRIDYMNAAAVSITGWERDDALGRPAWEVLHLISKDGMQAIPNPLRTVLELRVPLRLPAGTILVRRNGAEAVIEDSTAPILGAGGKLDGAVIVFHDVTHAHDMMEQVTYLATHDFLTDLPNRRMLLDRIGFAIAAGTRDKLGFAILYLDLDNLKHVNDSLGHAVGDKLLCAVARRLKSHVRATDTASRPGGDEFVLLILDTFSRMDAAIAADKILDVLMQPYHIDQHELYITASIGISQFPDDGTDAIGLIKDGNTAMHDAKARGGNNRQFFVSEMNARAVERQRVESTLRHALNRKQLVLYYQPKVDLRSGRVVGAEALLRWQHPEWGLVAPERFISVAEDFGLIIPMGRWVLRQACLQARKWQASGMPMSSMSVNVSAVEFRRQEFIEGVQRIIAETGISPETLELEITESVLMADADATRTTLNRLKDMGIRVAVDDFGTGYSSLSYLRRFPIDVLKIDRSFVSGIGSNEDDGSIAGAVISMGNSLKYRVVAEGVEDRTQLDFLRERRCDEAQGYYFSAPLDATGFERLLAARPLDWRALHDLVQA